jgi:hypothetical protein
MAHPNRDERKATVGKVLRAGIEIKGGEAKLLSVVFTCSPSAILADAKGFQNYLSKPECGNFDSRRNERER